ARLPLFGIILLVSLANAEDFVAVNSFDGRDVLSGIFYANVKGYPVRFLPSPAHDLSIFLAKVGSNHSVLLVQSAANPVSILAESELRYSNQVELYASQGGAETNLDLAKRSGAESFIVVDSAYSDSAISAIPYAALTKSYVLLADKGNIAKITEITAGKKVTIFGYVDRQVRDGLSAANPTVIGKGEDKYEDNVEIVRMMVATYNFNRSILSDGAALEDAMASGTLPILLMGKLIPLVTYDFLKENVRQGKITGVLLIGNELITPVQDMRERIKNDLASEGVNRTLGVVIKFAQAMPSSSEKVLSLDTFGLPAYVPLLNISEVVYNRQNGKVMMGVENTGDGPLYYTSEIRIKVNGQDYRVLGRSEPALVERGGSASDEFSLDLSGISEGSVTAVSLVKFGSSKRSLDQAAVLDTALASIDYVDNSIVSVKYSKYDKANEKLLITIKNDGDGTAFVFAQVSLFDENGILTKVSAPSIRQVDQNSLLTEEFLLGLNEKELSLNKNINVSLQYGGRRGFLTKSAVYSVPLEQEEQPMQLQLILVGAAFAVGLLLVLFLLFIFLRWRKRKGE
ncbi:TPA: cell wall-binding repeat-containing protein, partial [Candidatus Micrarchaeota archaeon]|nr:cell wall-binding repeat-containing protein [Candidatus Micrarchaeota archaeon]